MDYSKSMFAIVIVLVVVATVIFVFFVDFSVDTIGDWLARKVGLLSGAGGIMGFVQIRNDEVVVSLECQGADAFVAVI